MRVLVTGASGFVGSALMPFLRGRGHEAVALVRSRNGRPPSVYWDPAGGTIDRSGLEGFDGVVHLAGESISSGRWSAARKARIRASRVRGTRLLAGALAGLQRPPAVLVSASATGFYGDRLGEALAEGSPPGSSFLAQVCREWEDACEPARKAGIRVVNPRIGVVLGAAGGALRKMLAPFRLGLGGRIGSGRQYLAWIALDDLLEVILYALVAPDLEGPVNAVAPAPVTNLEFTRTLARVLRRPAFLPLPGWAARLALGEMAEELLLASARARPCRLLEAGFVFHHPVLEAALRHALGK